MKSMKTINEINGVMARWFNLFFDPRNKENFILKKGKDNRLKKGLFLAAFWKRGERASKPKTLINIFRSWKRRMGGGCET